MMFVVCVCVRMCVCLHALLRSRVVHGAVVRSDAATAAAATLGEDEAIASPAKPLVAPVQRGIPTVYPKFAGPPALGLPPVVAQAAASGDVTALVRVSASLCARHVLTCLRFVFALVCRSRCSTLLVHA
jgi:hypothetical protein